MYATYGLTASIAKKSHNISHFVCGTVYFKVNYLRSALCFLLSAFIDCVVAHRPDQQQKTKPDASEIHARLSHLIYRRQVHLESKIAYQAISSTALN